VCTGGSCTSDCSSTVNDNSPVVVVVIVIAAVLLALQKAAYVSASEIDTTRDFSCLLLLVNKCFLQVYDNYGNSCCRLQQHLQQSEEQQSCCSSIRCVLLLLLLLLLRLLLSPELHATTCSAATCILQ
jgi:hypothetical protein